MSIVLTEIYSKFAKPFIQIAGPKNIQHNANRMHVAGSRSNLKIHYKLLFSALCCICLQAQSAFEPTSTRKALQTLSGSVSSLHICTFAQPYTGLTLLLSDFRWGAYSQACLAQNPRYGFSTTIKTKNAHRVVFNESRGILQNVSDSFVVACWPCR